MRCHRRAVGSESGVNPFGDGPEQPCDERQRRVTYTRRLCPRMAVAICRAAVCGEATQNRRAGFDMRVSTNPGWTSVTTIGRFAFSNRWR